MTRSVRILFFVVAGLLLPCLDVSAVTIREIRVETGGPVDVSRQSVLAHVDSTVGGELSRATVSRDLKALEKTGRFSHVEIRYEEQPDGVVLIYEVDPKYTLRTLSLEGIKEFSSSKARDELGLRVGEYADAADLDLAARRLRDAYKEKHYYKPEIEYVLDPDETTGRADVTFDVDEGPRGSVHRIHFEGNEDVERRRLRKLMEQGTWNILSFISQSGLYQPEVLERDLYRIRQYYLSRGYLDVEVRDPEVEPYKNGKRLRITIPIEEGDVYDISRVSVQGVDTFEPSAVSNLVELKRGEVASLDAIRNAASSIRDYYNRRGYIDTVVRPDLKADLESRSVEVAFDVREGEKAFIRDVLIEGNTRTKDEVIRRELVVYPGELYDETRIRTSEARVRNLRYFEYVRTAPRATPEPDEYDVVFEVQEKKTGQFIVGLGFSSVDDLIGFAEVQQGNFNLFGPPFTGGGQKLKLRLQVGTERRDVEVSFTEPWFLNRRLSLSLDLFQHDRRFLSDDYSQRNTGGRIGVGKAVGRFNRLNLSYTLQEIDVYDVDDSATEIIKAEEGARVKSAMRLSLIHDSRDSFFVSTRGNRTSLSGELAGGPLGADTDLYLLELRSTQYWPLWFGHVLNLRGEASVVEEYGDSDRVPIFDRLFMGGPRDIRAFDFRDVGPKDEEGEPIGGRSSAYAVAEYTVPIVSMLRLAGYYDIGMVWPDAYQFDVEDYNSGIGVGARIDIPGFPFRLDYAWPLEADEFNDSSSGRFSFMLGYVF